MTENEIKDVFLLSNKSVYVFDEFNRLPLTLIKSFFEHIKTLNSKTHPMVCLTFNPGYVGRTEVFEKYYSDLAVSKLSMQLPDYKKIIDIMLLSHGFRYNSNPELSLSN